MGIVQDTIGNTSSCYQNSHCHDSSHDCYSSIFHIYEGWVWNGLTFSLGAYVAW